MSTAIRVGSDGVDDDSWVELRTPEMEGADYQEVIDFMKADSLEGRYADDIPGIIENSEMDAWQKAALLALHDARQTIWGAPDSFAVTDIGWGEDGPYMTARFAPDGESQVDPVMAEALFRCEEWAVDAYVDDMAREATQEAWDHFTNIAPLDAAKGLMHDPGFSSWAKGGDIDKAREMVEGMANAVRADWLTPKLSAAVSLHSTHFNRGFGDDREEVKLAARKEIAERTWEAVGDLVALQAYRGSEKTSVADLLARGSRLRAKIDEMKAKKEEAIKDNRGR